MYTNIINEFKGPYHCLSNFYPFPVSIDGVLYYTNEHFFQAFKTTTPDDFNWILNAPTPGIAKRMGSRKGYQGRKIILRPDWDNIKDNIMAIGLAWKFGTTQLKQILIDTDPAELIEGNRWHDNYWGDCYCVNCLHITGKNKLGKILMLLRIAVT